MRPGARAPQRDAAHQRRGRPARDRRGRAPTVTGVVVVSATASTRDATPATSSSSPAARRTRAKLLLASANDRHPNGLANGSDQVGRNYMFHNSKAVLALSQGAQRDGLPEDARAQRLLLRHRRLRLPDRQHPDGRQVAAPTMYRARSRSRRSWRPQWSLERGRPPRRRLLAVDRGPAAAREPRHARRRRQHHARATRSTNDEPKPSGSTTSSSRCSTTSGMQHDHLLPRHAYMQERHPGRRRARTRPAPAGSATDPATSVLDANCKAHELDNLYVVDTSFFPSIGAVNPALTAMANALRVGDHLLERLGAPQAAPEPAHVRDRPTPAARRHRRRRLRRRRLRAASWPSTTTCAVTLIDRNNYHQFQPLLYQVATSQLAPSDIAYSLRKLVPRARPTSTSSSARSPSVDPAAHDRDDDRRARRFAGDALVLAAGLAAELLPHPRRRRARVPALLARRRAAAALAHPRRLRGRRPRPGADRRRARSNFVDRRRRADRRRDRRRARRPDPRRR